MLFRDFEALDAALEFGSLSASLKQSLRETARPTIAFTGKHRREAKIPIGASKIGGDPDLPPDLPWPWRGPCPDGESYAAVLRELGKKYLSEACYVEADAVVRDFPLAFLCQINLDALAKEPGFDRALFPDRGRLLVFMDICEREPTERTWLRLIWDETPVEQLERREAPEVLKKAGEVILLDKQSTWDDWSEAEMLKAVSAVSICPAWDQCSCLAAGFELDDPTSEVYSWGEDLPDDLLLSSSEQLGGWCDPIQHWPVPAIVGAAHGLNGYKDNPSPSEKLAFWSLAYEWSKWQHVLTIAGESGTCRTPNPASWGDGDLYIFMRREDLQARRFEAARGITARD